MTSSKLSRAAEQLLYLAQRRGAKGLTVAGWQEQRAVRELVAAGLVRVEGATGDAMVYSGRIYVQGPDAAP